MVAPVGVSASVVLPAAAAIFPPGLTVQVVAVAADAALGLAAGAAAVTARAAAAARTTAPMLVRTEGLPPPAVSPDVTGHRSRMRWPVREETSRAGFAG
jgi:hypothetical protein